jgi:hypothetical protein
MFAGLAAIEAGAQVNPPAPAPTISATAPMATPSGRARTTITWKTGSDGGVVMVSASDGAEELFSRGPEGSVEADWIQIDVLYEFRLYTDTEPRALLASVRVQASRSAAIAATPNPVADGPGLGRTEVSWTTGDDTPGVVLVSVGGGAPDLFATGASGTVAAEWIQSRVTYEFTLYREADRNTPIASVSVTRGEAQAGSSSLTTVVGVIVLLLGLIGAWALSRASQPNDRT